MNLTVNTGVKITEEDEYPWPFPEAAFVKRIDGTDNADSVTIAGNTLCQIAGIYLGKGNDTVTLQNSSVDGYVIIADDAAIDMGDGNDTLTCNADTELQAEVINFGAGDDKFIIAQDGDYFASDIGKVNFGAGNDTWEVGVDGDVEFFYHAEIDFGEGNDKLHFKEKSYLECWGNLDLDFGAGDDTLVIDKNADVEFHKKT